MADEKTTTKRRASAKKRKAPTKADGSPLRKGVKGPSTTGKVVNVQADQANWRTKLQQSRIKFDDPAKERCLEVLQATGLKGKAAQAAGVSQQLVRDHLENDPDFAEAYHEALENYRDILASEVRRRGADGYLEPVYNKDGRVFDFVVDEDGRLVMRRRSTQELVYHTEYCQLSDEERKEELEPVMVPATIRKFSDRMLELDIKRVDPTYRDKQTIDLNGQGGGVLVAPAGMTVEEAIAEGERANEEARKKRAAEEAKKE